MLRKLNTGSFLGVKGDMVVAELDIGRGMPGLRTVGLAGRGVKEAGLRIRSAMSASGFKFPNARITINLSPAGLKKEGSHFDLPCALGLIYAKEGLPQSDLSDWVIFGELSLDGGVLSVTGLLPMLFAAYEAGYRKFIIPQANEREAAAITDGEIYKVSNLKEAFLLLSKEIRGRRISDPAWEGRSQPGLVEDFADVKGQEACKRGLAIAVAGGHGVIMLGRPGIGKTMLARRIPSIMPAMTNSDRLEITAIHSVAGLLKDGEGLLQSRPFRQPQPTITPVGMLGGGRLPKPGELSLAHGGILFLDELTSFPKKTLELMRGPLEDGYVKIARASATVDFPARPLIIMASNPCSCGWLGDKKHKCTCTQKNIADFWDKLSGPLLDRVDIQMMLNPPSYADLSSQEGQLNSKKMRVWVERARQMQKKRFGQSALVRPGSSASLKLKRGLCRLNADMSEEEVEKYCKLDDESGSLLSGYYDESGMTARSYFKLLKVARTIADTELSPEIKLAHILEAYQYNKLDDWKEACLGI